ncbi:MAG: hypothetical protein WC661_04610 [Opitutaceae bacterium]|jgi:hypothetical protein
MNTRLRFLALPPLLIAATIPAQAVLITEDFNSYTTGTNITRDLTWADGFGPGVNGLWIAGWRSASSNVTVSAQILNTKPLAKSSGNYLSGTIATSATYTSQNGGALGRPYDITANSLSKAPFKVSFDFRADVAPEKLRFDIYDNAGHAANSNGASWQLIARDGLWHVRNARAETPTTLPFATGVRYAVSIQVDPINFKWSVVIDNGTAKAAFDDLDFRQHAFSADTNLSSEGGRWFMVGASETTEAGADTAVFSLDNISITTAP